MSLLQNTSEINKTDKQVYLINLIRQSADQPTYLDHMVYENSAAGQKFMAKLVAAFVRAEYRKTKIDNDHYQLTNGLDKITLTGELQDVYQD